MKRVGLVAVVVLLLAMVGCGYKEAQKPPVKMSLPPNGTLRVWVGYSAEDDLLLRYAKEAFESQYSGWTGLCLKYTEMKQRSLWRCWILRQGRM